MTRITNHPYRYLVWDPEKKCAVEVEFLPSRRRWRFLHKIPHLFAKLSPLTFDVVPFRPSAMRSNKASGFPVGDGRAPISRTQGFPDIVPEIALLPTQPSALEKCAHSGLPSPAQIDSDTSLDLCLARDTDDAFVRSYVWQAILGGYALAAIFALHIMGLWS